MKKLQKKLQKKHNSGFTLVELIVVLVILAILAAIMVPALSGWIQKAKDEKLKLEARHVAMAADSAYYETIVKYPNLKADGNSVLISYPNTYLTGDNGTASNYFSELIEAYLGGYLNDFPQPPSAAGNWITVTYREVDDEVVLEITVKKNGRTCYYIRKNGTITYSDTYLGT